MSGLQRGVESGIQALLKAIWDIYSAESVPEEILPNFRIDEPEASRVLGNDRRVEV